MEVNDMTQFAYEASKKSEPTKEFILIDVQLLKDKMSSNKKTL